MPLIPCVKPSTLARRGELVRLLDVSPRRERTAILIPIQLATFLLIAAVMVNWFSRMHRRNHRSLQAIVARMSPDCHAACSNIASGRAEDIGAIWMKAPRLAFRDAGVLMEMADYAERNMRPYDSARIQIARNAALQLRLAAARAIIRRHPFG